MADAEKKAILKIFGCSVRAALERHTQETIGNEGDKLLCTYGINTTCIGATKDHQTLLKKTMCL
jgi:hypothetical protein